MSTQAPVKYVTGSIFSLFCLGGYFLAIAYGVTFLIPMLVEQSGGDEAVAGLVISSATISTVLFVVLCGHLTDCLGANLAVVLSSVLLAIASFGFAFSDGSITLMMLFGFILGIGWGVFYTLGPIILSSIIEPSKRVQYFALLSGCMMTGIGTGPLLGRMTSVLGVSLEQAFIGAGVASLLGAALFIYIRHVLERSFSFEASSSRISATSVLEVVKSPAKYAIVMVGLGACIFSGLSSFQSSYAQSLGHDYSLFFIGFVVAVISCRLFVSGFIVKRDPLISLLILTALVSLSLLMFLFLAENVYWYVLASVVLGIGYGLTYSVINGLTANEAPTRFISQSLLLFSLSYFVGVFGFPLIAGQLIVSAGMQTMLYVLLVISLVNHALCYYRLYKRARLRK
ncbi:MAG: MFS family permease [Oceanospirillaceae bacterium]|jgi:MFS family permease